MRVIRGKLKSRRFATPKSFPSRPTTDYAKEGLFNILENKIDFENLEVLDLCSGTGNISLEFASREAKHITSVDTNYNCTSFIQKMIVECKIQDQVKVIKSDVRDFLRKETKSYDLIFADPPFDVNFHEQIVQLIFENNLLKEDGILIIEHGRQTNLSENKNFDVIRSFGNVNFSFFKNTEK